MLDIPNGTYWSHWKGFVEDELAGRGLIAESDCDLFLVTDDVDEACDEIVGFYSNYDSLRYVGDKLVMRLKRAPSPEDLARLDVQFADMCRSGGVRESSNRSPWSGRTTTSSTWPGSRSGSTPTTSTVCAT